MPKDWIDAEFEVVGEPVARKELPAWFKAFMLIASTLMLLGVPIWRFNEGAHSPPPVPAAAPPALPEPSAR